ncbi:disease resistance protein [Striga asiatica]|uniref:Disease resistance protein n=1 Tax=Striga asiatica TaxID=4170 RepID=A0A5A7QSK3_STRAF|nr:disease resistance protein [Striga asiatica]
MGLGAVSSGGGDLNWCRRGGIPPPRQGAVIAVRLRCCSRAAMTSGERMPTAVDGGCRPRVFGDSRMEILGDGCVDRCSSAGSLLLTVGKSMFERTSLPDNTELYERTKLTVSFEGIVDGVGGRGAM